MKQERRINFRVDQDIFKKLDDLRHSQGTTWQDLAMRFFASWLRDAGQPGLQPTPGPSSASIAYPHGEEILRRLGEAYWTGPEWFRTLLTTELGLEPDRWEEIRPARLRGKAKAG